jgi:perosamine synthetase
MDWKIPLFKIYWDDEDIEMVTETIRSGMYWANGPHVQEFEKLISEYFGVKYSITFNSGTSALHAILLAYGIGPGDEVIVPSFTFIATANAPLFVGATPVFADIEETTYGLNPESVRQKITPKTKAIIPVHYGGCPCLIEELKEIAGDNGLILIEDSAESFGAKLNGKKAGTFGDAAVLSFCANKVITTGEGGAVTTNSEEIYEKLRLIRSHGRAENENYFTTAKQLDYITLGYNYRISDITAALGISQLKKLDRLIEMRRQNAKALSDRLSPMTEIEVPYFPEGYLAVYQMYTIRVKAAEKRDALVRHLNRRGIMSKVYFDPIHHTDYYRNTLGYNDRLPVTERLSREVLTLPMYPDLTGDDLDLIAQEIIDFLSQGGK